MWDAIKDIPAIHNNENECSTINSINTNCFSDCMMVASQEGDYVYVKNPLQYNGISKRSSFNLHRRSASALDGREISDNMANEEMLFEDEQAAQRPHEPLVPDMAVCGIYFVTDATKIVEVTVKRLDINCETGGLMGVSRQNSVYFLSSIMLTYHRTPSVCRWLGIKWSILSKCQRSRIAPRETCPGILQ